MEAFPSSCCCYLNFSNLKTGYTWLLIGFCFAHLIFFFQLTGNSVVSNRVISSSYIFYIKVKSLAYELTAAGRPLSTQDFKICVFKFLKFDFCDFVTTLATHSSAIFISRIAQPFPHSWIYQFWMPSSLLFSRHLLNVPHLRPTMFNLALLPLIGVIVDIYIPIKNLK